VFLIYGFALVQGESALHAAVEAGIVAAIAFAASLALPGRTATSTITSFGLITSSAVLTHLSGGFIEFHFHFFIMLAVIALYQEWPPFLLSILYVAVQHTVVGVIDPHSVFNHPDAIANPWKWAGIHAMFISFACAVYVVMWRWNEAVRDHAKQVLDSAGEGIIGLSPQGEVVFMNPAAEEISGYSAEQLLGRPMGGLLRQVNGADHAVIEGGALALPEGQLTEGTVKRRDGTQVPAEFHRTLIRDRRMISGSVITLRDTSERKRAEETIRYLAYHDSVTGLPNRALFQDRFAVALAQAQRHHQAFVLMSLDLDRFKAVNDSLGHAAGDSLLQEIGQRLASALRQSDTVARVGGDEFMLLLPGSAITGDAAKIAAKLLKAIARPLLFEGQRLQVSGSIGISLYPYDGDDAETLLKRADSAMYRAKERGRNNYRFFKRLTTRGLQQHPAVQPIPIPQ
jgi:diguanylate cyclase (GGDEF)-like protein/PAS domain S-box-containing protein